MLSLWSGLELNYEITYRDTVTSEVKHTSLPSECPSSKPWLLVIHPVWVDLTWLRSITQDDDFLELYNIITFDQRDHGRTQSALCPTTDFNTMAADLAFAMQKLSLPPVSSIL